MSDTEGGPRRSTRRRKKRSRKARAPEISPVEISDAEGDAGTGGTGASEEGELLGQANPVANDELAALAAEAGERFGTAQVENEHPPPAGVEIDTGQLEGVLVFACKNVGGVLCRRAQVEPIADDEAQMLGRSIVQVLDAFGFAGMVDPRVASTMNLAVAAITITVPRIAQLRARREAVASGTQSAPEALHP